MIVYRDAFQESLVGICELFIYGLFLYGLLAGLENAFIGFPHFNYIPCVCACGVFSMICDQIAKIFKRELNIPSGVFDYLAEEETEEK